MNKSTLNLQDVFLNQCRKDKVMVTIYLTNGFQFKGLIKGFDNYIVILDAEGKQQLVIAIGCTGGMHRSVAIAEELFKYLKKNGVKASIVHRDYMLDGQAKR